MKTIKTIKLVVIYLLGALYAFPAQVSISIPFHTITHVVAHPVQSVQSISAESALKMSIMAFEVSSGTDYISTEVGIIHGPYCEANPLFAAPNCGIRANRFRIFKAGVALAGILEWTPIWLGWHSTTYSVSMTIINTALTAEYTLVNINNFKVLTTSK